MTLILSQKRWKKRGGGGYSNAAVRMWLGKWEHSFVRPSVALCLVDTIQISFSQITSKLHMYMQVSDDERRNCGFWVTRSRSTLPTPLARGCRYLRCPCYHLHWNVNHRSGFVDGLTEMGKLRTGS